MKSKDKANILVEPKAIVDSKLNRKLRNVPTSDLFKHLDEFESNPAQYEVEIRRIQEEMKNDFPATWKESFTKFMPNSAAYLRKSS